MSESNDNESVKETSQEKQLQCAECGSNIKKTYFKCQEMVVKQELFEGYEVDNCFCSKECFCNFLELEKVSIDDKEIQR